MADNLLLEETGTAADLTKLFAKCEELVERFEYELALKFFDKILTISPKDILALQLKATVLMDLGDFESARSVLLDAVEISPSVGYEKYHALAQLEEGFDAMQRYVKALEILQITDMEDEKVKRKVTASIYCSMAELYMTDLCFEADAESQCDLLIQKALEVDPGNYEALQTKASMQVSQCIPKEAFNTLVDSIAIWSALEFDDDDYPSYEFRLTCARLLVELGGYEYAEGITMSLSQEDDEITEVWYLLAMCLYCLKKKEEAFEALENAERLIKREEENIELADAILELREALDQGIEPETCLVDEEDIGFESSSEEGNVDSDTMLVSERCNRNILKCLKEIKIIFLMPRLKTVAKTTTTSSDVPLYYCSVSPRIFQNSRGIIKITMGNVITYLRYAAYIQEESSTIRLPKWFQIHLNFPEYCEAVEVSENDLVNTESIKISLDERFPLPCSKSTLLSKIKEQLIGHIVTKDTKLPLIVYGTTVFADLHGSSQEPYIIDEDTEIIIIDNFKLEMTLPKDLNFYITALANGVSNIPRFFILNDFENLHMMEGVLTPPFTLLLGEEELDDTRDLLKQGQFLLKEWANLNLSRDRLQKLTIPYIHLLSTKSIKKICELLKQWSLEYNIAVIISKIGSDKSKLFTPDTWTTICGSSENLLTRQQQFLFNYNCNHLQLSLEDSMKNVLSHVKEEEYSSIGKIIQTGLFSWDNIYGYSAIKNRLTELLYKGFIHKDIFDKFGLGIVKGILLHGPSGCGKTAMVKAIANDGILPVIQIRLSQILSKYLGDTEANLRRVFTLARKSQPCILYFDNVELFGRRRNLNNDTTGVSERLLSTLLNEMDGIVESKGVLVLACTSKIELLDEALIRPGRLDHHVHIPLPSDQDIIEIFEKECATMNIQFNHDDSETIASHLIGFAAVDVIDFIRTYLQTLESNANLCIDEKVLASFKETFNTN